MSKSSTISTYLWRLVCLVYCIIPCGVPPSSSRRILWRSFFQRSVSPCHSLWRSSLQLSLRYSSLCRSPWRFLAALLAVLLLGMLLEALVFAHCGACPCDAPCGACPPGAPNCGTPRGAPPHDTCPNDACPRGALPPDAPCVAPLCDIPYGACPLGVYPCGTPCSDPSLSAYPCGACPRGACPCGTPLCGVYPCAILRLSLQRSSLRSFS